MSDGVQIAVIYSVALLIVSWNFRVALIEFGEWLARARGWKP